MTAKNAFKCALKKCDSHQSYKNILKKYHVDSEKRRLAVKMRCVKNK